MKTLFIFLLPLAMFSQSKVGWMFINENTIDLDKQMHFTGGASIATASYFVALGVSEKRSTAKIWGILVPTLAGTIKELADTKTTGFNTEDLAYTVGGAVVATYTFDFIVHRAKRREQKRQQIIAITDDFYENNSKESTN